MRVFKKNCPFLDQTVQLRVPARARQLLIFTARNEVWGKVMFLHLSVSHSVHGGVSVPACTTGHITGTGVSVQGGISVQGASLSGGLCPGGGGLCPWGWGSLSGRPPKETPMYGNERAVRILLECILVIDNSETTKSVQYLLK